MVRDTISGCVQSNVRNNASMLFLKFDSSFVTFNKILRLPLAFVEYVIIINNYNFF